MQRWRGLDGVPSGWGRCVVTIGVFDGVHRGHQQLIGRAIAHARELGLPTVLITFDPHPASVLRPGTHPARLTTLTRRAELVAELGVDAFWVLPFTPDLARVAPDEFVHELLVDRLHAAMVVVGRNFTFGHKAAGDVAELVRLGQRFGFAAEGVDLVTEPIGAAASGSTVTFSSTYVRACISAGDVRAAAEALGRPHRLEGVVVRGDQRGRELGYPTANVDCGEHAAIPADGVYACWFHHQGRVLPAATSVGTNPTFSGRVRTVEVFVLDSDEDLYGARVGVDFVERLRGMDRFDSIDELIVAMDGDVARTREVLGI
ncbi:bifunctional riboflavin kinase/FAD synthetase [Actinomycetospora straminea]|uniref:bifunctional riboflavin kinase/FAD synthetase n=1 Tax=Actinomycetospora straminea TaxID=663607 RepID=UPI002366BB0E|nr:bifunctional riboflavin kinase/FAD synthetase [Actinomycetospora straminea]MDD7931666.1 bifunctional riboflavin kinase/FAD synthetase [Actinomycetospora straminea]